MTSGPGPKVVKLEFILRLKVKRNDWLLADTCPQAAKQPIIALYFEFEICFCCFISVYFVWLHGILYVTKPEDDARLFCKFTIKRRRFTPFLKVAHEPMA